MEEVEVFASGGLVEGEQGLELEVVEQASGLAVGESGVNEAHGPFFELAALDDLVDEDLSLGVAWVTLDGFEDDVDVGFVALKYLKEGAGVVKQHAGEAVDGVAGTRPVEELTKVFCGKGTRGGADID